MYLIINKLICLKDCVNIKILNAGAWSRSSDKVTVTLPPELEDYIPEVDKFYRNEHSGRKLTWHHLMSSGVVSSLTDFFRFFFCYIRCNFKIEIII